MEISATNLKPGLYLVSTPIGNLEDVTIRALRTLRSVDVIFCENTLNSLKLLNRYGIKNKLESYNDHSDAKTRLKIIDLINRGKSIALISDAGTPLISDPGYKLVAQLTNENIYITGCPGACSAINALALSGVATDRFTFEGFLPQKQKMRIEKFKKILSSEATTIIFDTGNKILDTLKDLKSFFGNIEVTILREMTKKFEEKISDNVNNLIEAFEKNAPMGEIVMIIPAQNNDSTLLISQDIEALKFNKNLSAKDIVNMIMFKYPYTSKTQVYNLVKPESDRK